MGVRCPPGQPSPATCGTANYDCLILATNIELRVQITNIQIKGTIGGLPCTWLVDTAAQLSVLQKSPVVQAKGCKLDCKFVPYLRMVLGW